MGRQLVQLQIHVRDFREAMLRHQVLVDLRLRAHVQRQTCGAGFVFAVVDEAGAEALGLVGWEDQDVS